MIPPRELLVALVNGNQLETAVPQALEFVARDPLTIVHSFRGDLLRGLMEIPAEFWSRHPMLFDRYLQAVRAGAAGRRRLPPDTRLEFWSPLELRDGS